MIMRLDSSSGVGFKMLSVPSASGATQRPGAPEPAILHAHRRPVAGIDADHGSGHVAGVVGGQETDDAGDLVGIGQPAHGHRGGDRGQQLDR